MGLGILGGGINTAKWLLKQGVKLTITDLRTKKQLSSSLKSLGSLKKQIKFISGKHDEKDILENEIIVINPGIPLQNPYLRLAIKKGKQIENELSLFYKSLPFEASAKNGKNIIAVTGTRGKTTTTNWTHHLIKAKFPNAIIAGNSPDRPLLQAIDNVKKNAPVIIEVPSFLLEHSGNFNPKIAVITNIYKDHLNRYESFKHYILTKANIFRNQTKKDLLILNKNNLYTKFLLKQSASWRIKSRVLFFSNESVFFDTESFKKKWGEHNFENLSAAVLTALHFGISRKMIKKSVDTLPQIKFRQELVYKNHNLEIHNDTTATSPEATIAAVKRFKKEGNNLILITGGTDMKLDFSLLAKIIKQLLSPKSVVFLDGSATVKLKKELKWKKIRAFNSLAKCLNAALKLVNKDKSIIVFSPGSKSFEKFKNEYDRGEQFNKLVHEIFHPKRN